VDEIRARRADNRLLLHEKVGHLGIFVSASVAKRGPPNSLAALDLIEALPPGLYEAIIRDTKPDIQGWSMSAGAISSSPAAHDRRHPQARRRPRRRAGFESSTRVADQSEPLRQVRFADRESDVERGHSALLRDTNPARLERWFLSDSILDALGQVDGGRQCARIPSGLAKNPFAKVERDVSGRIEQAPGASSHQCVFYLS